MAEWVLRDEAEYMTAKRRELKLHQSLLRARGESSRHLRKSPVGLRSLDDLELKLKQVRLALDSYDRAYHGDRQGAWMPLYSGKRFWPADPRPEDIDIVDIARSLSRMNRFNGMTRASYSVAQHCVLGSYVVERQLALAFLLHDSAETYMGDLITPYKRLFRQFYEPAEDDVMRAVAARFNLPMDEENKRRLKRVDNIMLATEVRDLTPHGVLYGVPLELPLDIPITRCWSDRKAEQAFLERYAELRGGHAG